MSQDARKVIAAFLEGNGGNYDLSNSPSINLLAADLIELLTEAGVIGEEILPRYFTIEEVATSFGLSCSSAYRLKAKDHWPSTEFGSKSFRFTADQVAQITAMYLKQPQQPTKRAPRIGTRANRSKP